ncbi:hypothetical protein Y032_0001g125 [Ancylostoma ceylanicum]|uniref:Uncharacterized protein n=1 Tax=Ancylostoma ceylanicum TaxID=53326 RepID=A0A016W2M3_9BILA|nr:hypothetical protein Y032_0001g125 [Ancylostoma ceylanicum]
MFYACLATFVCFSIGIGGIILSFIDIERWNFGLYFALLSVVGTTVSVAFWIISPSVCGNPRCIQWIIDRYGYKVEPCRNCLLQFCGKDRRRFWEDDESSTNNANMIVERRKRRGNSCAAKKRRKPLNRAWTVHQLIQARPISKRKVDRTYSVRVPPRPQETRTTVSHSPSAHVLLAESSGQNCTDIEIV